MEPLVLQTDSARDLTWVQARHPSPTFGGASDSHQAYVTWNQYPQDVGRLKANANCQMSYKHAGCKEAERFSPARNGEDDPGSFSSERERSHV